MKGAKVAAERCSTCIFGPDSPIGAERMRDLAAQWKADGGHQVCHRFGVGPEGSHADDDEFEGEDVWCRGFFDTQAPSEVREFMLALHDAGCDLVQFVPLPNEEKGLA